MIRTSSPTTPARLLRAALALTACAVGLLLLLAAGGGASAQAGSGGADYPPGTIIEVRGDAANGFDVVHLDGTTDYPPTDSEARAECGEYDTRVARVRCRAQVLTYYRDLGALQHALDYAYAH